MDHRTTLRFGEFVLDRERSVVSRRGEPVHIGHRALAVLELLLASPGKVVEKRRILDVVWSDAVVVEDNLVQAIHELRIALGDSPHDPRYIETVHRRGYRFIATVHEAPPDDESARERWGTARRRPSPATLLWLLVGGAFVVAGLVFLLLPSGSGESASSLSADRGLRKIAPGFLKPAISPSGALVAAVMASRGGNRSELFLLSRDGERRLPLARGMRVQGPSPVFSADG